MLADSARSNNSVIIEPCLIGEGVEIDNSVVGPHVTLSAGTKVSNSVIKNSIVYENTIIENEVISNSMIGTDVTIKGQERELSMGSFSTDI